jgi:hypothetical protein
MRKQQRIKPLTCYDNFVANIKELERQLRFYLEGTAKIPGEVFSGPSLYFHQEAIKEARTNPFSRRHLELIYAVLPSWGMHRMGGGKKKGQKTAKVIDFEYPQGGKKGFEQQLRDIEKKLKSEPQKWLKGQRVDVNEIVDLIFDVRVSQSDSYLVSSSKTMHHILPDLIPPIDRAYSIRFMRQTYEEDKRNSFNTNSISIGSSDTKNQNVEQENERKIVLEKEYARMFIREMQDFIAKHEPDMREFLSPGYPFNTSLPKIFDNLIVAFIRAHRKNKDGDDENDDI